MQADQPGLAGLKTRSVSGVIRNGLRPVAGGGNKERPRPSTIRRLQNNLVLGCARETVLVRRSSQRRSSQPLQREIVFIAWECDGKEGENVEEITNMWASPRASD